MKYLSGILGGEALIKNMKVGATVAKDTFVMVDATNNYGHCIPTTTTSAALALGLALSGGTYTATPTVSTEGVTQVIINPFAIYRGRVWGSATKAELSAATLNVQTQTSASATVITSAAAYSNDKDNGTLFILTGANAGLSRVLSSHVDATSCTVTVALPALVAVGDKAVAVQCGIGSFTHQPTTDLTGFDDSVASGTGIRIVVVDVELALPINATNPEISCDFMLTNMAWNPLS